MIWKLLITVAFLQATTGVCNPVVNPKDCCPSEGDSADKPNETTTNWKQIPENCTPAVLCNLPNPCEGQVCKRAVFNCQPVTLWKCCPPTQSCLPPCDKPCSSLPPNDCKAPWKFVSSWDCQPDSSDKKPQPSCNLPESKAKCPWTLSQPPSGTQTCCPCKCNPCDPSVLSCLPLCGPQCSWDVPSSSEPKPSSSCPACCWGFPCSSECNPSSSCPSCCWDCTPCSETKPSSSCPTCCWDCTPCPETKPSSSCSSRGWDCTPCSETNPSSSCPSCFLGFPSSSKCKPSSSCPPCCWEFSAPCDCQPSLCPVPPCNCPQKSDLSQICGFPLCCQCQLFPSCFSNPCNCFPPCDPCDCPSSCEFPSKVSDNPSDVSTPSSCPEPVAPCCPCWCFPQNPASGSNPCCGESTVNQEEQNCVCQVPVIQKVLQPVVESRVRCVPVVKQIVRTFVEPVTINVPVTEKCVRQVEKCFVCNVPVVKKVCKPVACQTVNNVPVSTAETSCASKCPEAPCNFDACQTTSCFPPSCFLPFCQNQCCTTPCCCCCCC